MSKNRQESIEEKAKMLVIETTRKETQLRYYVAGSVFIIYLSFVVLVVVVWGYDLFWPFSGRVAALKDMILTMSGLLAGPFGLIIGYYFGIDKTYRKI
jgi:hypothetical protein